MSLSLIVLSYVFQNHVRPGQKKDVLAEAKRIMQLRGFDELPAVLPEAVAFCIEEKPEVIQEKPDLGHAAFHLEAANSPKGLRLSKIVVELANSRIPKPTSRAGSRHQFLCADGFSLHPSEDIWIRVRCDEHKKKIRLEMELTENPQSPDYKRCFCHAIMQISSVAQATQWILRLLDAHRKQDHNFARRSLGEIFQNLGELVEN